MTLDGEGDNFEADDWVCWWFNMESSKDDARGASAVRAQACGGFHQGWEKSGGR